MLDLIIIGSSAAGSAAGIYAARRNLNFKIVTIDTGGEVALSGEIGNYPGFGNTDGIELSGKFLEHLKLYDVEPEIDVKIIKVTKEDDGFFVVKGEKAGEPVKYEAKAVLTTTGVHPRFLGIPGEEKYRGKGVTYCTTCDGPLFRDKVVATIGGGNSALESALMMNEIAAKVYLINKNPQFKGEAVLIDKVKQADKVEIIYEAKTAEVVGEDFVKGLKYTDKDGKEQSLDVEGIFVHIGMVPNNEFLPEGVETDKFGQVVVDKMCASSLTGFYAAGDVTDVPYKQIAIASGQGVCAVLAAIDYINKLEVK